MQGDSEDVDKECEESFYARPVQDTQPPDPSALLRPRYRYPWPVSVSDQWTTNENYNIHAIANYWIVHSNYGNCCKNSVYVAQGGQVLQQNAAADSTSQASFSIDAVLARIETRLRSLAEQLSEIEDRVSNLHMVSHAVHSYNACTITIKHMSNLNLRRLIIIITIMVA